MAKLIGGPAHGAILPVTAQTLSVPVVNNTRAPKGIRHSGIRFLRCVYTRTQIIRNGEIIYKFTSGYYVK